MTRLLPLFILIVLLLTGCSDRAARRSLDHAEAIMEAHPDSALRIIEVLDPASFSCDKSTARYALLYSQALDKNYIDLTDDSLICIAEDYYERKDDLHPLMLSYFYHGRIKENAGELPQSLRLYTKSLECARLLGDDFWCGRAALQIADLYLETNRNSDFQFYARMAYEYFIKSERQPFINYSLYDVSRAYFYMEDYEKSIVLSTELKDSAEKYNDNELISDSYALIGKAYYLKKEYQKAIDIYESMIKQGYMNTERYSVLGICYLATDQREKALAVPIDTVSPPAYDTVAFMYELARSKQDNEEAHNIYGRLALLNDSVLSMSLDQNFGQTLSELYAQERIVRDLESRNHRFIMILTVLLAIIIIMILIYISKRQNDLIDRKVAIASDLEEILSAKENDLKTARVSIRKLLTTKYEVISHLFESYYTHSASKSLKKKISDEIDSLIADFSDSEERIAELETNVDSECDNIISSLKTDLPGLKQADRLLFLYSVLGFSLNAIALILKEEKMTAVYNRKRRLKDKIKSLDPAKAEIYLSFLN